MSHGAQALARLGRNTRDLARAVAFYRDALGFRVDGIGGKMSPPWTRLPGIDIAPSRCAHLSLGAQQIELTEFVDAAPYPDNSTACDLWFQHCAIVVSDMPAAHARVIANGAVPITQAGPQALPPSTGLVTAFKFRDPDGHPLELIHFPAGTGDPAWQAARTDGPTLGIDHTAISIRDVKRSVPFYELLGLHVTARGVNRGIEQQHLDALADVEVDVVALQAAAARTPHLELLGYRQPHGRTHPPPDFTASAADRTVWRAEAIDVLLDALADADFTDAVITSGFSDGATLALLRDPDGHLLVLTSAA